MSGAEVVLLRFNLSTDEPVRVTRQGSVQLPASRFLVHPVDLRLASGGAYVITSEACTHMVQTFFPVRARPRLLGRLLRRGRHRPCALRSTHAGGRQPGLSVNDRFLPCWERSDAGA